MRITQPNYTQAPNELFDHWLPHLGEAELKVLLVIMRKTFGWHKKRDRISLTQLAAITGLQRETVIKATFTLQEKGLIIKEVTGNPGTQVTHYELVIEEDSNNSYQSEIPTGPVGFEGLGKTDPQKKPSIKENSPPLPPCQKKEQMEEVGVNEQDFRNLEDIIKYMKSINMMPFDPAAVNAILRKTSLKSLRKALWSFTERSKNLAPLDLPDIWLKKRALEEYEYEKLSDIEFKKIVDRICGDN